MAGPAIFEPLDDTLIDAYLASLSKERFENTPVLWGPMEGGWMKKEGNVGEVVEQGGSESVEGNEMEKENGVEEVVLLFFCMGGGGSRLTAAWHG